MKTIPISDQIKTLEDARRLALNSKGNPRSLPLIRFLDTAICDLKAKQGERKPLREYVPSFFDWRKPCQNPNDQKQTRADVLDALWHRIHALQVEIVEGN